MSTEAFAICSIFILPIPPTPFAIYFGISISILLLCGKCSRKTLNCRHLLAENNSCAFMRIESIRKCQCINILLRSLSFLPYTLWVWQYGLYMAAELFVLFSPSLWGWEKLCQLCLGSTCSTAMYLHLHLHFHCGRQRCAACPSVWQWTLQQKTHKMQEAGRERERKRKRDPQYSWYLVPQILQFCKPTWSFSFKAVKLVFCPTKPKWSVFSVVWFVSCLWYVLHATLWNLISWQS